jgi:hypothetical protein
VSDSDVHSTADNLLSSSFFLSYHPVSHLALILILSTGFTLKGVDPPCRKQLHKPHSSLATTCILSTRTSSPLGSSTSLFRLAGRLSPLLSAAPSPTRSPRGLSFCITSAAHDGRRHVGRRVVDLLILLLVMAQEPAADTAPPGAHHRVRTDLPRGQLVESWQVHVSGRLSSSAPAQGSPLSLITAIQPRAS